VSGSSRPRFLTFRIGWLGLVTSAGFVLCAATLLGFLGRFWWLLDLFSHFRVQYFVGLAVLGLILLFSRRGITATLFLLLAAINLAQVLPLYFGAPSAKMSASATTRLMLINVNAQAGDPARVRETVRESAPDILVLEEVDERWITELSDLHDTYPHSVVEPREDDFGVALFSKLPLLQSEVVFIGSAGVPSIDATVEHAGEPLRILATHPLPPGGRDYSAWRNEQLRLLAGMADASRPFLLVGDLNTTPWNFHFRRLLADSGLRDSAEGFGIQPSWPTFNPLFWIPLDHVLHSPHIVIKARTTGPDVGSDHYPVVVDFATAQDP